MSTYGKSCLSAAIDELARYGVRNPQVARGSKHIQVRWTNSRGQARMMAVPNTPSDWRSPENTRRDVRRVLREDGMASTPATTSAPPRTPSRLELLERRVAELERLLATGR
jgi:hypothetical protein